MTGTNQQLTSRGAELPPIQAGTPCEVCSSIGHEHTISLFQAWFTASYVTNLRETPVTFCGSQTTIQTIYSSQK